MAFILMLVGILPFTVPVWLWFRRAPEATRGWAPQQVGTRRLDAGSYREAEVPVFGEAGAPRAVRVAAVGAWVLGTMFVPGLLLGLVGLFAAGVGLVSVPGLVLAARLFLLGTPLLHGDAEAAPRARAAAQYAIVLNIFVLIASLIAGAFVVPGLLRGSGDAPAALAMVIAVMAYAGLSLVHARFLNKAADAIDARWTATLSERLRTGVRFDTSAPTAAPGALDAADFPQADAFVDPLARGQKG